MSLPPNLLDEAKTLRGIVEKAASEKAFTGPERAIIDRYKKEFDFEQSKTFVSSQLDLARLCGVDRKTISRRIKTGTSPGKEEKGYCVETWKAYLGGETDSLSGYVIDLDKIDTNSAEIHAAMLKKAGELHQKLQLAEKASDLPAIAIFEKRWLAVAKEAKNYENLIQKHDLEVGETIRVSEMEEVEFFVILVMLDAANRFLDEFAIISAECENEREVRAKAEPVFEEMVKSQFTKAVRGKKLDERVLSIWDRAIAAEGKEAANDDNGKNDSR